MGGDMIPVKFSVRDRDLAGTIQDVQARLAQSDVHLPDGYHIEWAGESTTACRRSSDALAVIIPITLIVIFGLLYTAFNSLRHALLVLGMAPFALTGGVLALLVTGTPFSISAAVGFASVIGVSTLGGVVFVSGIRRHEPAAASVSAAITAGALAELRPVLMACARSGTPVFSRRPCRRALASRRNSLLARVIVGGMVSAPFAILFVIPVLASYALTPSSKHATIGREE